jgi:hypothetical protein
LFRLTLIITGLPIGTRIPVHFDDRELESTGNGWLDLYFAQSTSHTVIVDRLISTDERTQYQVATAEIVSGTKTTDLPNYTGRTSVSYAGINETAILVLSYEPFPASSLLILVLPSVVLLVLTIGVSSLGLELYLGRRKNRLRLSPKQFCS